MKLFTTKDCRPCEEVKKYIVENDMKIEIIEVDKDEKGNYNINGQPFNPPKKIFPMLQLSRGKASNILCGKEGILQILDDGYIYEEKECPYYREPCKKGLCAKFAVLYRGAVPEGGCSDFWNAVLGTEIISSLQGLKKEILNVNTSESKSDMGR